MTATQAIRDSIQTQLRAIDAEVIELREALTRLDGNGTTAQADRRARQAKPRRQTPGAEGSQRRIGTQSGATSRRRPASASADQLQELLGAAMDFRPRLLLRR